ncbi:MAG: N-formylglutamate amidohydrolase [Alphaproteobacteria bacterium]|nr:N-formylglutamate amidohydrolase [Alphaproteobacteria bacterium]
MPGTHDPAFSLHVPERLTLPIVIAAPHGGRNYPPGVSAAMREPEWSQLRLEDRLVDRLAREVAEASGAALMVAHAPRALLDLNRAPDDIDWSMVQGAPRANRPASAANRRARNGLGLVPRRLPGLGEIWREGLTLAALTERIDTIHRPYHVALSGVLDQVRDQWGAVLLLDLHSMPPLRPRAGQAHPAEFVIGDRFGSSCHDLLSATALRHLSSAERRVAHNRPYAGGYVLERHGSPRRGVHALQLEVCRSAYLDAEMRDAGPRFPGMVRLLAGLVRALAAETAALGADGRIPLAAE